jgi:glycosyltransferase involved in cell wall biosynthesis
MNRGGIETSLMHVLRHIDRTRYRMDFLTLQSAPGAYDEEIRALGSQVLPCPTSAGPWRFAQRFMRILREFGPYDIVHSHVHYFGGFALLLTARHGVPGRIAHSRNDNRVFEAGRWWPRLNYVRAMKHLIGRCATSRVAISRTAADDLFGATWADDPGFRMIFSGRDFSGYAAPHDPGPVRRSLGLPDDALVIGHVGRFYLRKNHDFVVEVAAEAMRGAPRVWLLLVGDGPDQARIEARVRDLGIAERVLVAGARADVPRLMAAAMDVFVFPSHHEGLGLVLVEAQAVGLPCVLSDALPEEVDVVPGLMHRLPLGAPAAAWPARLLELAAQPRMPRARALALVRQSDFDLARSLERLIDLYDAVPWSAARSPGHAA